MEVDVRLFAILRERAGAESLRIELPDGASVGDALETLRGHDGLGGTLARMPVRLAVNREYADESTALAAGDEIALVPPVSGGGPVHVHVTGEALDPGALSRAVIRPGAGAVVTFQGVTREVERLDYEAYEEMARERIAAILAGCVERHGLEAAAAGHRVGSVARGEPSVVVAVSAAHREQAFAAAREAIDEIKASAPIWKREVDGEKARWVEGTTPA